MSQLFGFSLQRAKKVPKGPSFVQKDSMDGSQPIVGGGYYGYSVDFDGTIRNEYELITRYREMVLQPECDSAVDDVVNETICGNFDDVPVELELSNLKVSDKIKKLMREEFDEILRLLDFENRSYEIFRRWYVDGRLFYHKVIDPANPTAGLNEIRYIDPRKIRKVTEYEAKKPQQLQGKVDLNQQLMTSSASYYLYNAKGLRNASNQGIKIAPDSITYCHSGIQDLNKNMVLSHLHKAIKAVNQLRMIEDSLVIYRLSRAPERRIFYIDVGNLPRGKSEQYMKDIMAKYRNKLVYDAKTGEIRDDRKHQSMLEDFWLPRREGGRGTEITTLPGGENLGQIDDIIYFQKRMYRSLNVPITRLEPDQAAGILGRATEINRDELKFQKFIDRLRARFAHLFYGILKKQLILKGIATEEDWDSWKNDIDLDYVKDNHFTELRDAEILRERLSTLDQAANYAGEYYSKSWIMKNVLMLSDEDIENMKKEMDEEERGGEYQDDDKEQDQPPQQQIPDEEPEQDTTQGDDNE